MEASEARGRPSPRECPEARSRNSSSWARFRDGNTDHGPGGAPLRHLTGRRSPRLRSPRQQDSTTAGLERNARHWERPSSPTDAAPGQARLCARVGRFLSRAGRRLWACARSERRLAALPVLLDGYPGWPPPLSPPSRSTDRSPKEALIASHRPAEPGHGGLLAGRARGLENRSLYLPDSASARRFRCPARSASHRVRPGAPHRGDATLVESGVGTRRAEVSCARAAGDPFRPWGAGSLPASGPANHVPVQVAAIGGSWLSDGRAGSRMVGASRGAFGRRSCVFGGEPLVGRASPTVAGHHRVVIVTVALHLDGLGRGQAPTGHGALRATFVDA